MTDITPFRLKMAGDTAQHHNFQGYDGFNALAGFAWTLSMIANYVETGEIRQRGNFPGREAVRAMAPKEGSVLVDFVVYLQSNPEIIFGSTAASSAASLMYAVTKRVIRTNVSSKPDKARLEIAQLGDRRQGDIEALIAISENPIRRMHDVIGNGATNVEILGGVNLITNLNSETEKYVRTDVKDNDLVCKDVSISWYNANTGHGGAFDSEIGRVVPFSVSKPIRSKLGPIFSWGLDQYTNKTGAKVNICYRRILRLDGRPRRYLVESATN